MQRHRSWVLLALLTLLASEPALGDKDKAREAYKKGMARYLLND